MTGKELITAEPLAGLWMEPEELFPIAPMGPFQVASFPEFLGKNMKLKVEDGKKELKLSLKTPGYDKKHLKVSVKNGMLTFCGERREENSTKGSYCSSYGSFSRSLPLPEGVNAKKAKVQVKDGEVIIAMPKNACN